MGLVTCLTFAWFSAPDLDLLELRVEFGGGEHGRTYAISARDRAVGPGERTPFRVATRIDGPPPPGPWTLVVTKVRTP